MQIVTTFEPSRSKINVIFFFFKCMAKVNFLPYLISFKSLCLYLRLEGVVQGQIQLFGGLSYTNTSQMSKCLMGGGP